MKKYFTLLLFVFLALPQTIQAASTSLTITWTMSDTTDVQGYKVYYSDNIAMTNRIWHSDCSSVVENPDNTFSVSCHNLSLTASQPYYFSVAAQIAEGDESASDYEKIIYINPVNNLRVETPQ